MITIFENLIMLAPTASVENALKLAFGKRDVGA